MDYDIHPAAGIFLERTDEEVFQLAESIAAHGLESPVVLCGNMVLDGRARLRACELAGTPPEFDYWDGHGMMTAAEFVAMMNVSGRQLSMPAKAAAAVLMVREMRTELTGSPDSKGGNARRLDGTRVAAIKLAAGLFGMTPSYLNEADLVRRQNPEAFEQMRRGEISITAAYNAQGTHTVDNQGAEKRAKAKQLADAGHTDQAAAKELGISVGQVRKLAKRAGGTFYNQTMKQAHSVDPNRILEQTASAAVALFAGVDMALNQMDRVDMTLLPGWIKDLESSAREMRSLINKLKETVRENCKGGEAVRESVGGSDEVRAKTGQADVDEG